MVTRKFSDKAAQAQHLNRLIWETNLTAGALAVYRYLRNITGDGLRPFIRHNKDILEDMGIPFSSTNVRRIQRCLASLRAQGFIESLERPAGQGRGSHRLIRVKEPQDESIIPDQVAEDLHWWEIKDAIFEHTGQFSDEWEENVQYLLVDEDDQA